MTAFIPVNPVPKSTFVTVVAWIFMILAGFATCISVLQNIMITFMFPAAEMQAAATQMREDPRAPRIFMYMFEHMRLFVFTFLVLSAATLVSSIGLLLRKEWARVTFVALMAFGILWNIGGMVLMYVMFSSMSAPVEGAPQFHDEDFQLFAMIMMGFNLLLALGITVLFGWIIKKLLSTNIRQEFAAH